MRFQVQDSNMIRTRIDGLKYTKGILLNDRSLKLETIEMLLSNIGEFTEHKGEVTGNSITYTYDLDSDRNSDEFEDYEKFIDLDLPESVTWKYFRNALSDPYITIDHEPNYPRFSPEFMTGWIISMEKVRSRYKKRKRNGKIFKQKSR